MKRTERVENSRWLFLANEPACRVGNTDRTPYLFNGKELDEETGLYYYGARYYDPRTSVWQSVDPMLNQYLAGSHNGGVINSKNLNFYAYTYQNPIVFIDSNGKQTHLLFWGGAKKYGDNSAFYFAALNVKESYSGDIAMLTANSGESIVKQINTSPVQIATLDFFTHGSQYALYMVQDTEGNSSSTSKNIEGKTTSNNLYASKTVRAFQSWGGGSETDVINNINYDKFTNDAIIEIHGCKSGAGTVLIDNIAINLSENLYAAGKEDAVVIAHMTKATPRINGDKTTNREQDYRHGKRGVYYNGELLFETNKKGNISRRLINKHLIEKRKNEN